MKKNENYAVKLPEKGVYLRKLKNFIIMPKIYEYFGFIFFFYSKEREPIHVHVIKGECQTVFELIIKDGTLVEVRKRVEKGVYAFK